MYRRKSRRNEERRRGIYKNVAKIIIAFGLLGVTAYYAYDTGVRVAQNEGEGLREKLDEAKEELRVLERRLDAETALLEQAKKESQSFKDLYEQVKPDDEISDLTAALRQRLSEGIGADRLLFAIKWAKRSGGCVAQPDRRFAVRTPRYSGSLSDTTVRVADSILLTIEGAGVADGREVGFDANQPVNLKMSGDAFGSRQISAKLPIEETVPIMGGEVRFTIRPSGIPGFVEVKSQRCGL